MTAIVYPSINWMMMLALICPTLSLRVDGVDKYIGMIIHMISYITLHMQDRSIEVNRSKELIAR